MRKLNQTDKAGFEPSLAPGVMTKIQLRLSLSTLHYKYLTSGLNFFFLSLCDFLFIVTFGREINSGFSGLLNGGDLLV